MNNALEKKFYTFKKDDIQTWLSAHYAKVIGEIKASAVNKEFDIIDDPFQ